MTTTKNKKKHETDFSHIETDEMRNTFIENPDKVKEL